MAASNLRPHYGGQLGLLALISMIGATGCVALTTPVGTGGPAFLPAWIQQTLPNPEMAAHAKQISEPAASFIVRFIDEPELQEICRNFRKDEAAGRAAFMAWADDYPELDGLYLIRASYSGDLLLALPSDDPAGRTPFDVIEALEALENIDYAEIDEMAKIGGDEK